MHTIALHISKRLLLVLLTTAVLVQLACKKNSHGGSPVITDVRAVDSTARDSLFTKALPGTLIVIQGHNLDGLQAVYFNDTSASFNPAEATGSNIIVTIPSGAPTAASNPNVPSQIKVVTDHGTAVYSFTLYLPSPKLELVAIDSSGTMLTIVGSNLSGVSKITFPGNINAPSFTVDTNTIITVPIPAGVTIKDSVRIYCTFGTVSFPFPPPIVISSASNENAVAGTTLTITGQNFIGVSDVIFPGGIPGTNLQTVNITKLTVTVPPGVTTGDVLRVVGASGTSTSPFVYNNWLAPSVGFQANFDGTTSQWSPPANNPYFGWDQGQQWAGTFEIPPTPFPNATGNYVALDPQSAYAPGDTWYQDNLGFATDSLIAWADNQSTAVVGNYALKFECYVQNWKAGALWIGNLIPSNTLSISYMASWAPWKTAPGGTWSTDGWTTITIPLTSFLSSQYNNYTPTGTPATTITQLMGLGYGKLLFTYANDGTTTIPGGTFNMGIDNIRIVRIK